MKGPDQTFTTLPIPAPSAQTGGVSGIGVGSATFNGTIDPHDWDTTYLFQYGTSTSYEASWPTVPVDMGALEGPQPLEVGVPTLLPDTTYHYRLVASNGGGTTYGQDATFTTSSYPVEPILEPVTAGTLLVPSESGKLTTAPKKKGRKTKARRHTRRRRGHQRHHTK